MLYIVLLIVAVAAIAFFVIKKRGANANQSTQTTAAKKPVATPSKAAATNATETKKATTPLSADTRRKIEALIEEANFFAAEAQINQALNRDNTQHELYLFLLDIHILQKDEFAINQLVNHLKGLELDETLKLAEAKVAESQKKDPETIEYSATKASAQTNEQIDEPSETPQPNITDTAAFDQLYTSTEEKAEEKLQNDLTPLDFNFTLTETIEASSPVETEKEPSTLKVVEEAPALDFNFNIEPSTVTETPVEVEKTSEETAPTLDFSFTQIESSENIVTAEKETPVTEQAPTLDFNFTAPLEVPTTTPVVEAVNTSQEPNLDFDLSAPIKPIGTSFDLNQAVPPAAVDTNDPLVQSFPELIETNEITLNLDLAQQYIKLGAFQAARDLLDEKQTEYSTEQRQIADDLRKKIA